MNRVTIYLGEDLHRRVKALRFNVSEVCQAALWAKVSALAEELRGYDDSNVDALELLA